MRPNKHEPGRVSRETGGQRSPQHPFTSSKGGTEPLALLVHLADVNAIHSPDATRNGLAHASEHLQRSVATLVLNRTQSLKVDLVLAIRVDITKFSLELCVDSVFERSLTAGSFDVVVASLGVEVEHMRHWEDLTKLEHSASLVRVLHPHHGFTSQVTNGVVDVSPENTALLVTTVTGVETETCKETNGSCSSSESRDGHG
mmetsp:Transcript_13482/g.22333  ORF Transcript_13482/g.22333 Transcript_13482/m.22333 type:complete len:201 (+) Transcript_13482:524-1126(+)